MEFKPYHKIRQFKDVIRDIQHTANYAYTDANGDPVYNTYEKPTITFEGTVKLHGTNAGIAYTPEEGVVAQKRTSLLEADDFSSKNAHFGFNQFVQLTNRDYFNHLFGIWWDKFGCFEGDQMHLFGEWAGKGVQKGVGISEREKAFYVFDLLIWNPVTEEEAWVDISGIRLVAEDIYNIHNFPKFQLEIDFNTPAAIQNILIEITNRVEHLCPVAASLGVKGVGEGVVWSAIVNGAKHIFKVKGAKHSVTGGRDIKQLAPVDEALLQSVGDFIDYSCSENRIEQGIMEVGATEKKHMPALLKWVANDIITEEHEAMKANNLEWKQVSKEFSNRVRQYYFTKLDTV
jgi:hypothetical protein